MELFSFFQDFLGVSRHDNAISLNFGTHFENIWGHESLGRGDGQRPRTQRSRKQTTGTGKEADKQQSTTAHHRTTAQHHRTQHRGAEHQETPHQATGRRATQPDRDSTTKTRHHEPRGPTRRQQRTARPNSKHPKTAGNNTQHQPAPEGREITAQRATTQAHQHSTAQEAPRKGRRPETRHKQRQHPDNRQHSETAQHRAQG